MMRLQVTPCHRRQSHSRSDLSANVVGAFPTTAERNRRGSTQVRGLGHGPMTTTSSGADGRPAASSSDALVLFGGTGDLARKKIYPALLAMVEHGHLDAPVIAVARTPLGAEGFRNYVREHMSQADAHREAIARLTRLLDYVQGDY